MQQQPLVAAVLFVCAKHEVAVLSHTQQLWPGMHTYIRICRVLPSRSWFVTREIWPGMSSGAAISDLGGPIYTLVTC